MKKTFTSTIIKNKRAYFDYEIIAPFVAGMVLAGTEMKSLREGKANLTDGFCTIINGELFARNIHINEYFEGTYNNHKAKHDRKLLLNKRELEKISTLLKNKSHTVIPLKIFFTDKGWAKLEIAVAKGKKEYDKRDSLKTKDAKREIDSAMKQ
ncbi:MAG: SsrA-binding protein SmpB [Bacteroidia bacterium]|nr:SsrA-binding protein SmpB [Bacteroidia bacterium]